jgi:hypothetical protein
MKNFKNLKKFENFIEEDIERVNNMDNADIDMDHDDDLRDVKNPDFNKHGMYDPKEKYPWDNEDTVRDIHRPYPTKEMDFEMRTQKNESSNSVIRLTEDNLDETIETLPGILKTKEFVFIYVSLGENGDTLDCYNKLMERTNLNEIKQIQGKDGNHFYAKVSLK